MSGDLFEAAGPFAALSPVEHVAEFPGGSWLEMENQEIWDQPADQLPAIDRLAREQIESWRARQAAGDVAPRPGCWGEYVLRLASRDYVAAVVEWPWILADCPRFHVALHGPVSETGYHSIISLASEVDGDFGAWLLAAAERCRAETVASWRAARDRQRGQRRRSLRAARSVGPVVGSGAAEVVTRTMEQIGQAKK